ncbi:DUF2490 domain-containing protein [Runella sp. MFBS21]|uniref:DUF2490 domain-containing protein n=1 Tax=Runella sp. MFBS21 TaxID=3034018 RepID=UPI0023F9C9FC|nr:DUF2490 domain-containing protein [Runella sp. MFBS21]MDF7818805.1 DUF2490 domain-containing protein [Runella sp. MFBS21]
MKRNWKSLFWKMPNSDARFIANGWQISTLVVTLWVAPQLVLAQATDIGLWSGIGVEKKINKSLSVSLNAQTRLTDNLSILRAYLGELGVGYKLGKHWEVAGYYRYIGRRKKNADGSGYEYRSYNRFYADLAYDHKLWKLKFDYRLRYQNQFQDDDQAAENNSSYVRNKFELSYPNKTRFTPYISTDLFYEIGGSFDQMRNKAGVEMKINKHHKLELSGFTDYRLIGKQENRFLIGLSYKIKL